MSVFAEMTKIRDKVAYLLNTNIKCRDDDSYLYAAFLFYELGKEKLNKMTATQLLSEISNSNLTPSDNITRVRRKLQEEFPEYRGEKYNQRHEEATDVKNNINKL